MLAKVFFTFALKQLKMNSLYPSYIKLYHTGELKHRVESLEEILLSCRLCPRRCSTNRLKSEGKFCRSGYLPIVPSFTPHFGEEPVLVGKHGSGTIFLGNCSLKCVYCQNYYISQSTDKSKEISIEELASILIKLQKNGCHNINFVSPTHFVPQLVKAVYNAVPMGLNLPIVYNTNSYDSLEILRLLNGIVDIYLPDIKYSNDKIALKYSAAKDYVKHSQSAVQEMWRQVGNLKVDENGIAKQGVLIRHLVLPGNIAGSYETLKFIVEKLSHNAHLSIMGQYYPTHKADKYPEINRTINENEYEGVLEIISLFGMEKNVYTQSLKSHNHYRPDFANRENPFNKF